MQIRLQNTDTWKLEVDRKYFAEMSKCKWYLWQPKKGKLYARATIKLDGRSMRLSAHQTLWLLEHGRLSSILDHADSNGLNCRVRNLREVDHRQNNQNRRKQAGYGGKGTTSEYKGVRKAANGKYQARIQVSGKSICLGTRDQAVEAAKLYNQAARKHFGKFAVLNDLPQ